MDGSALDNSMNRRVAAQEATITKVNNVPNIHLKNKINLKCQYTNKPSLNVNNNGVA